MEENKNVATEENIQENISDTVTMTKEELEQFANRIADKRVSQAQKTFEKKLEKEKSLAGLDAEARAKAEQKSRIAELEEEIEGYKIAATKAEISKVLSNRGLDVNLVDFVVTTTDNEECLNKIETLEKIFKKMVDTEVKNRLSSHSPAIGNINTEKMTKEKFKSLSLSEQNEIYNTDKELYFSLV